MASASGRRVFLIDYEFYGETSSGLDVIARHPNCQSVLVTSRAQDPEIIDRCEKLSVPCIPKSLVGIVAIEKRVGAFS